jgi:hypothetical protein
MRSIVGMAVVICVLACSVQVVSGAQEPPAKITVRYEKTPLPQVLKDLGAKLGVRLAFSAKSVAGAEPVTLELRDASPERVLRAVLRPRGLVAVHTGAKVAAILPAATDIGVAKTLGSAVRTSVRLAKKLGGAVQKGDEVQVPGWSPTDDEDVALVVADIVTCALYGELLEKQLPGSAGVASLVKRLTSSADGDVRAGAVLAYRAGCGGWNGERWEPDAAPPDLLRRMFADPDPVVRICWLRAVGRSSSVIAESEKAALRAGLHAGAGDAAPEVRCAAAIAMMFVREAEGLPSRSALTRDAHPAVRIAARVALLNAVRGKTKAEQRVHALALLKDPHPLVRTIGVAWLTQRLPRSAWKPEDIQALVKEAGAGEDKWLALPAHQYIVAALRGEDVPDLKQLTAQLASAKPSHRNLAMWALLASAPRWRKMKDALGEQKDVWERMRTAESLLPRLLDLSVAAARGDEAFAQRASAVERSPEESTRLSVLAALAIGRESRGVSDASELEDTILKIARRPGLTEGICGSMSVGAMMSPQRLVDELQREVRRDPHALVTQMLLFGLTDNAQFRRQKTDARRLSVKKVLDAVLAAKSPGLEVLITAWSRRLGRGSEEQALIDMCMATQLSPDAFLALLKGNPFPMRLEYSQLGLAAAVHQRLRAVFDEGDAAMRRRVMGTLAGMLQSGTLYAYLSQVKGAGVAKAEQLDVLEQGQELVRHMARTGLKGADDEAKAALGLLEAVLDTRQRNGDLWIGLPEPIEKTFVQALGFVNRPPCADAATRVLATLIRREGERKPWKFDAFPELRNAMGRAQAIVLEKGAFDQKFKVLCALSYCGQKDAVAQVAAIFMDGKLSPKDAETAIEAIGHVPEAVPEAFARHVIKLCGQKETPWNVLQAAMSPLLRKLPQYRRETVTAYCQAIRHGQGMGCLLLARLIRDDQLAARKKGAPVPPWVKPAAEVAQEVLRRKNLSRYHRSYALQLSMWAAGREADPTMEAFLRDDGVPAHARTEAAQMLGEAVPATGVYKALLPEYDKLPDQVRAALGVSAAQSPDAPQAEALVLRVFKDEAAMAWGHELIRRMKLPWSATLDEALTELQKNPRWTYQAKEALKKLRAGRPPRVVKPVIVLPDP